MKDTDVRPNTLALVFPEKQTILELLQQLSDDQALATHEYDALRRYVETSIPCYPSAIYAALGSLRKGVTSEAVRASALKAAKTPCKPGRRRGRPPKDPEELRLYLAAKNPGTEV